MSAIVRTLQFVEPARRQNEAIRHWRSRPAEERLRETLKLHREGNEPFKGGNPAFSRAMEIRHVRAE